MNLQSQLGNIAGRDEYIAESLNITKEEARELIKKSTFQEYLNLVEANADRGNVGTQTTQSSATEPTAPAQPRQPRQPATAGNSDTDLDKEMDDVISQFDSPTQQNELKRITDKAKTDPEGAKNDFEDFQRMNPSTEPDLIDRVSQTIGGVAGTFMNGLRKGMAESAELERIRELAGLTEAATTGSTSSGNIASTQSIVGDTSDSHKPSVKLRRNNRLEREEDEKQDAKERRKKKKEQSEESDIERLIKR